jgi:hypothetical protein
MINGAINPAPLLIIIYEKGAGGKQRVSFHLRVMND